MKARWWLSTFGWLVLTLVCAQTVQGGPLWDLLFGRRNDRYYPGNVNYPHGAAVTAYYPVTVYYPVTTYPAATYPANGYTVSNYPAAGYPAQVAAQQPLTVNYGAPVQVNAAPGQFDAGVATTAHYGSDPATITYPGTTYSGTTYPTTTYPTTTYPTTTYPTTTYPTTTYYPQATSCQGGVCATAPSGALGTTALLPATGGQTFVPAFPQAAPYRTVWYRIPVTSFRPVTSVDPATGAAVTALQPCTTYTWQARRVPHTTRFPLLSRLFGRKRQPATPALVYPYTSACIAPSATGVPLVTSGTAMAPGSCPPGTMILSPTQPGASGFPGGAGTSLDPADIRPRLESGAIPPAGSGAASSAPAQNLTIPLGSATGQQPPPIRDPDPSAGAATDSADSASRSTSGQIPQNVNAPPQPFDLRPVPDPDAILNTEKRFEPPRLIEPRDRSAALVPPQAGAFVMVAWPAASRSADIEMSPAAKGAAAKGAAAKGAAEAARPAAAARPALDDSGWRAAK
jgi:hypothetical protein